MGRTLSLVSSVGMRRLERPTPRRGSGAPRNSIPCNSALKAILEKYKLIHTHTARRTGTTLMYLAGVDLYDIMKVTGHCDYKSMKPYIDITEDAKRDAIKKMKEMWDAE